MLSHHRQLGSQKREKKYIQGETQPFVFKAKHHIPLPEYTQWGNQKTNHKAATCTNITWHAEEGLQKATVSYAPMTEGLCEDIQSSFKRLAE